mmetsp:Transcript_20503/g.30543  ORF Transcript_20503/g.30543 Transcript_20503/m.30543 type:complete len:204 (+) Transcript_20503:396-1007(+)
MENFVEIKERAFNEKWRRASASQKINNTVEHAKMEIEYENRRVLTCQCLALKRPICFKQAHCCLGILGTSRGGGFGALGAFLLVVVVMMVLHRLDALHLVSGVPLIAAAARGAAEAHFEECSHKGDEHKEQNGHGAPADRSALLEGAVDVGHGPSENQGDHSGRGSQKSQPNGDGGNEGSHDPGCTVASGSSTSSDGADCSQN